MAHSFDEYEGLNINHTLDKNIRLESAGMLDKSELEYDDKILWFSD